MTTYSMKEVSVTVNGRIITGFSEAEDAVTIEMNEEAWTLVRGAMGDTVRTDNLDETARITLSLLQTSEENAFFERLYNIDRITRTGVVPLRVTDLNTGRKYTAPTSWIVSLAPVTRGKVHNERRWIFETDKLVPGSNN
jgi:hypothetical protein